MSAIETKAARDRLDGVGFAVNEHLAPAVRARQRLDQGDIRRQCVLVCAYGINNGRGSPSKLHAHGQNKIEPAGRLFKRLAGQEILADLLNDPLVALASVLGTPLLNRCGFVQLDADALGEDVDATDDATRLGFAKAEAR